MKEYIPKDEVLDIIKSMPMDLVEEYVYELDGIWLDDDEKHQLSGETSTVSEKESVEGVAESAPTTDCISRQQAIEVIEGVDWYHVNSKGELVHGSTSDEESWYRAEDIYKAIEALPPVTHDKRTETHGVCSDCISRQAVVERLTWHTDFVSDKNFEDGEVLLFKDSAIEQINALPSAERTGEWVNSKGEPVNDRYSVYCSRCKAWSEYRTRYCGNCGSYNGGEK